MTRGPVPKRSEERRRRNKDQDHGLITRAQAHDETPPQGRDANPDWDDIAIDFYESLRVSGQAQFFEASDWAVAYYVTEMMNASLTWETKPSAHMFAAIMAATQDLMATEGARRRLRLELTRDRDEKPSGGVTALADYKAALGLG